MTAAASWLPRCLAGTTAGLVIAWVDNVPSAGEVSPIVVVGLLLVVTTIFGGLWGSRAWPASAAAWVCLPLAHVVKHVLSLPDTLHPNTWPSILMLAGFTLLIAGLGSGAGRLLHGRLLSAPDQRRPSKR